MTEGDRHTIHRLEAFSDIVMGFCIAELGVNLLIPRTAAQLPAIAIGAEGFAISFFFVAILWWVHHRLFKTFFVLALPTVVMNFAMLGALVLTIYFQQVALHFVVTGGDARGAVRLWLASYAVVYALLAAMLWIGLRARWNDAPAEDLRWGFSRAVMTSAGTLLFVAAGVTIALRGSANPLLIGAALAVVALRVALPKIADRLVAR